MKTGNKILYHIARRVGQQGSHCSTGNQPGNEKHVTGRKHINLWNKIIIGKIIIETWNVRKLKEKGKVSFVCNEMIRCEPLLKSIGLPSINEMVDQESESMVYKAVSNQAPIYLTPSSIEYPL